MTEGCLFKLVFSSKHLKRTLFCLYYCSQMGISANCHHASSHLPKIYVSLLRINLVLKCLPNSLVNFHKHQLHLNNGLTNTALSIQNVRYEK